MVRGAMLRVPLSLIIGACTQGNATSSSSSPVASVEEVVPAVVCPSGTDVKTRSSAKETETYCLRTLPLEPGIDVGPATIQTGPSVSRFTNGKVSAYGDYENGVKVGPWRHFHPDGTLFANGRYDEKGRRVGAWIEQRSNGKLRTEVTFGEGRLDGPWRNVWGGVVVGEGSYRAGLPSGVWTSHSCAGAIHQTLSLEAGKLEGPCARFEAGARKSLDGAYKGGKKTGAWTEYAQNGTRFESTWSDDVRSGPYRWLAPDGHVVMEGELREGKLDGHWVARDATGRIAKDGTYADGQLVRGEDVTSVLKLNGYERNAYCAYNLQGFVPLPTSGGPFAAEEGDMTQTVCDRF
jgi:antitoxin component YwqK of YwqJK toxin-antitoxin module